MRGEHATSKPHQSTSVTWSHTVGHIKICLENKVTHCLDCGHIVTCYRCTSHLKNNNDRCPICRVLIKDARRIYFT